MKCSHAGIDLCVETAKGCLEGVIPTEYQITVGFKQAAYTAGKGADQGDKEELEEVQHQVQPEGRSKVMNEISLSSRLMYHQLFQVQQGIG